LAKPSWASPIVGRSDVASIEIFAAALRADLGGRFSDQLDDGGPEASTLAVDGFISIILPIISRIAAACSHL
jgi:hypothetical protein